MKTMPTNSSLIKAAQVWTKPETRDIPMQVELLKEFASVLDEQAPVKTSGDGVEELRQFIDVWKPLTVVLPATDFDRLVYTLDQSIRLLARVTYQRLNAITYHGARIERQ